MLPYVQQVIHFNRNIVCNPCLVFFAMDLISRHRLSLTDSSANWSGLSRVDTPTWRCFHSFTISHFPFHQQIGQDYPKWIGLSKLVRIIINQIGQDYFNQIGQDYPEWMLLLGFAFTLSLSHFHFHTFTESNRAPWLRCEMCEL